MLPLKINIPVLLPPDMPFEVLTAPQQVYDALSEQGWAEQAVSLSDRVSARIKSEPLDSWIEWEELYRSRRHPRPWYLRSPLLQRDNVLARYLCPERLKPHA
jgi:hypothetical protein